MSNRIVRPGRREHIWIVANDAENRIYSLCGARRAESHAPEKDAESLNERFYSIELTGECPATEGRLCQRCLQKEKNNG
jgi:hypothetical protein